MRWRAASGHDCGQLIRGLNTTFYKYPGEIGMPLFCYLGTGSFLPASFPIIEAGPRSARLHGSAWRATARFACLGPNVTKRMSHQTVVRWIGTPLNRLKASTAVLRPVRTKTTTASRALALGSKNGVRKETPVSQMRLLMIAKMGSQT